MENVKLNSNGYSRIDELQKFVNSLNTIVNKYNKDTKNKEHELKEINDQIAKKNKNIEKANQNTISLTKKLEELEAVKIATKLRVKELEKEKTTLSFSDSDVQKMETQELNEMISSKHSKINKISSLINNTKTSISANNKNLGELKSELSTLESAKIAAEKSLKRTNALIELVNNTNQKFVDDVKNILSTDFLKKGEPDKKVEKPIIKEEPKKEEVKEEKTDTKDLNIDFEKINKEKEKDIKKIVNETKVETPVEEEAKKEVEEPVEEPNLKEEVKEEDGYSVLDEWKNELDNKINDEEVPVIEDLEKEEEPKEEKPEVVPIETIEKNDKEESPESEIEKLLTDEKIDISNMDLTVKEKLGQSISKVKDNLEVLKKHLIPLDLLSDQYDILYKIDKNDLDDLLSIITTDSDGNGMGFSAEYTYYCLNELATINVDKLIDVYNQEFMNITDKSGIISLLKKANPELKDFAKTIEANEELLKSFGIENTDEIKNISKRFIELDHPLFESMLNVFDKKDLVDKINSDPAIVDQILEYWENN